MRRSDVAIGLVLAPLLLLEPRPGLGQSAEAERKLGERFALEAAAQLPLVRDPSIAGYVDRLGQRIVAALGTQPFRYSFFVVDDGRINAFAVPGGFIYVNSGLLLRVGSDDELAGVLGHEVAHVHAHHLVRQQESTKLLNYAALAGMLASIVQPAIGAAAMGASAAAQLSYQRAYEQEADYLGSRYMRDAGFEPRGMLDFFQQLWEQQRMTPTFAPPFLLTHPLTSERLNNLEAVLRKKQWEAAERPQPSDALLRVRLRAQAKSLPAQELVELYRRELEAHPEDGRRHFLYGAALLQAGSYQAARESIERAIEAGYGDVDRELGQAFVRLRQLEPARASLSRAVEVHPDDALAHSEYGQVLEELSAREQAVASYRRAVELAPEFDEAHYRLGMLAGRMGDKGEGFFHLAMADKLRGRYPAALVHLDKAIPLLEPGARLEAAQAQVRQIRAFVDG